MNKVTIYEHEVGNSLTQVVDAREVWEYLGVATPFRKWMERRIADANLSANVEYLEFRTNLSETSNGGRPSKNYYLTLRGAELIAQMEKTDKGDEFRRYLLDVRDKHIAMQQQANELMDVIDDPLVQTIVRQTRLERRFKATEESVMLLEQKHRELQEKVDNALENDKLYTVDAYVRIKKLYMNVPDKKRLGKLLVKMSMHLGYNYNEEVDPYQGFIVGKYHVDVFKVVLRSLGYKNIF